jgi:signal peptidase I
MILDFLKRFGLLAFETIKVVLISLAIILPIRYFLIQPFYVEGASMEPNFYSKEYLIIDEISYRFHTPVRGEVVVLRNPQNTSQFYIKRIIGLPGERIKMVQGVISINDKELKEQYLSDVYATQASMPEATLGAGEYFVMGDNRANSLDSRILGPVPFQYLIGRVWVRGWPFTRISLFAPPHYN